MLGILFGAILETLPSGHLLFALLFTPILGYILYQTCLHPLAQYPGPFLAKLTNLYSVVHAFRADRHQDLYRLHKQYGRIVRFGPDSVSILDAQALQPIYGYQANVKKSSWYAVSYGTSIFNATDHKVHARKRRVVSQAFSDQALRGMEPHILSAIRRWCAALGSDDQKQQPSGSSQGDNKDWTQPKDMVHWSACLIFDVLGEICFGKTFNTSFSDENHFWFPLMTLNVRIINICGHMPLLHHIGFENYLRMGTAANRKRQVAFSQRQLATRLAANPTERRDIIYFLQQARDPETGEGYSQRELMSEVVLLLGAGSDTTNTAITATFYFLLHHPEILSRLVTEIRNAFPTAEAIVSGPLLSKVVYLRACIDESMRLCPPIPMDLPREVLPGGIQIGNDYFPAGTIVSVPTYSLHHLEEHFARPFEYDPSRWLLRGADGVKDGEGVIGEMLARQREAFVPFSIGPRACIGRNVAMLETEVSIARVLWMYDVRLAPGMEHLGVGREGEYKIKDIFTVQKEGPVVQFRAVDRS